MEELKQEECEGCKGAGKVPWTFCGCYPRCDHHCESEGERECGDCEGSGFWLVNAAGKVVAVSR